MKIKKYFVKVMSFIISVILLVGVDIKIDALVTSKLNPAKIRSKAENTLVIGLLNQPQGEFLPIYSYEEQEQLVANIIYEPLISYNDKGEYIPIIADGMPSLSSDKKTYTFKLKKGIKFSDGTQLTAKDVQYTFTTMCDPNYDGRHYYDSINRIEGAEDYKNNDFEDVRGIKVIDNYTLSVTFKEPWARNLGCIANVGIMPAQHYSFKKGNIEQLRACMKKHDFVGSGPYKLTTFMPGQYIHLDRNQHYSNGQPAKIENIIIKLTTVKTLVEELKNGSLDIVHGVLSPQQNVSEINELDFVHTDEYPENYYGYMMFNFRDKRLADKNVRQALTYGLNRQKFNDFTCGFVHGRVCHTPISTVSWAYTDELKKRMNSYEYNPNKAIELLEKAGWKKGKDGIRKKEGQKLNFKWITYTGSGYAETLIQLLKEDWAQLGVKVEIKRMQEDDLFDKVFTKQDFEIANLVEKTVLDPDDKFANFYKPNNMSFANNPGSFINEKSNQLLELGRREFDGEKRKKIYTEWGLIINDELPYLFLNEGIQEEYINNRVKNFDATSYEGLSLVIKNLELEK